MSLEGLTVEELRNILVQKHGMTPEEAAEMKGKVYLREYIAKLEEEVPNLDAIEEEPVPVFNPAQVTIQNCSGNLSDLLSMKIYEEPPKYTSKEWEDYVLGLFQPDELYEGKYPTLPGLRRVASYLFPVLSSTIKQFNRTFHDKGEAFCVYELILEIEEKTRIFNAVADATAYNMGELYSIYPAAIAENRAEARCYRKALGLTICAADEMKEAKTKDFESVLSSTGEYDESEPMSSQQEIALKMKCKQLGIDYDKIIPPNATKKDALALMNTINVYQQSGEIPESLKV